MTPNERRYLLLVENGRAMLSFVSVRKSAMSATVQ